jgi:hypothetical protein
MKGKSKSCKLKCGAEEKWVRVLEMKFSVILLDNFLKMVTKNFKKSFL